MLPKQTYIASLGTYTVNGANTIAFAPGSKVKLKRLILVYTTAHTTPGAELTLQRRPIAGTAANQETLAVMTTPAAVAAGAYLYYEFGTPYANVVASSDSVPGGYTSASPDMPEIDVGEDFAIVSDGGGDAGVANVYVEYIQEPFSAAAGTLLTRDS